MAFFLPVVRNRVPALSKGGRSLSQVGWPITGVSGSGELPASRCRQPARDAQAHLIPAKSRPPAWGATVLGRVMLPSWLKSR